MPGQTATVRDLRRLWKPQKERLCGQNAEHPTSVRFHRACSWIQRAEQITDKADLDLALLNRWFAFNALYGRWDNENQEPIVDNVCWRQFCDRLLSLDQGKFVIDALMDNNVSGQ